jgi:hypothetical protein
MCSGGGEQAMAAPPWIGQRGFDGMAAVEPKAFRARLAAARRGLAAGAVSMLRTRPAAVVITLARRFGHGS